VKEGTPPSGMHAWQFETRLHSEIYHIYSNARWIFPYICHLSMWGHLKFVYEALNRAVQYQIAEPDLCDAKLSMNEGTGEAAVVLVLNGDSFVFPLKCWAT
jgi:hypothetical protein